MDTREVIGLSNSHGQKRSADDNLDTEQRLTKRFNLLNIENVGKLYIPVEHPPHPPTPPRRSRSNAFSDSMNLDDTRDRIYIHNLDDEISDVESEEEKLVFLPDIEKRLTKIPKSILYGQSQPHTSNEVILYSVPESLSIPPEQDNVRKAIIESRERARQKQLESATRNLNQNVLDSQGEHYAAPFGISDEPREDTIDEDEMDIG